MEIYSSEEQQVEAIKRFWKEYGKVIIGGVVIGLAGLYGFRYFQAEQRANIEQASTTYNQLLESREKTEDADQWLSQAQGFIANSDKSSYTVLAAFLAAKEAVSAKNYDAAISQLNWILTNTKEAELLALAQIRLAKLHQDQGQYDAALSALNAEVPQSFVAMQSELKGDILVLAEKLAEAKTAYQKALASAGANQQLLQIKLDELAHITAA